MKHLALLVEDIQTKYCPDCERTLPVTEFHRRNHGDGLQSYCKPCQTKRVGAYNSTPQGAKRRREYMRNNPEQRALATERNKRYRERNREELREKSRLAMAKAYADPAKREKKLAANREYAKRRKQAKVQP